MDLSPARVLSPPHIPVLLQRLISTPGEIRTLTEPGLNRIPLPVGIRELKVGRVGVAPTVFLMCLIYSQVPSLLGIPAQTYMFWNEPCRHVRELRSLTVAAFAVCIQSAICPAESKLSLSICHPVCAWLIATRKKTACLFGQAAVSAKLNCFYLIIPVCA